MVGLVPLRPICTCGTGAPSERCSTRPASSHMTWPVPLAVNIIIYALTQKGSITQRLMQMVN